MTDELNPNQPVPGQPAPAPALPDHTDPEFAAFETQLKRYLGFGVSDLQGSVEVVRQLAAEREASLLRQTWGQDYDANFQAVQERLTDLYKTNPSLAQSLNNAEGAKLVYAQIAQERAAATAPAPVPGFQRSYTPATPHAGVQPLFKESDILAMNRDERRARHAEITAAYAQGLVSKE